MNSVNRILLLILALHFQNLSAQESIEEDQSDAIEKVMENNEYVTDDQDITALIKHSINLNLATENELLNISGFTPARLEAFTNHIHEYGPLKSLYELQLIEGFDPIFIASILPYITIGSPFIPASKDHSHELVMMASGRLEKAKGYKLPHDDVNAYLGSPVREVIRYKGAIGRRSVIGFNGEKDAGEKLKYALQSGYLQMRFSGPCKHIILGDYMAAFGQGLTFGNGIAFGKTANVLNVLRTTRTVRPSRSLSENAYLRGISSEWELGDIRIHACYALNKLDGIINQGNSQTSSITSTGYYRSEQEIFTKGNVKRSLGMINMQYAYKRMSMGITSVCSKIGANAPDFSVGSDYQYHYKNILFFGEVASNPAHQNLSGVNGLIASLDKRLDVSILYRHYAVTYSSVSGNAFGESSTGSNERGLYMAMSSSLNNRMKLDAYIDLYRFPVPKYQVDGPSSGRDMLAEIQYSKRQDHSWYIRYKAEQKVRNEGGVQVLNRLETVQRQSLRFHVESKPLSILTLKTRAEFVWYDRQFTKPSKGLLMFQDMQLQLGRKLKINVRYMIFDTDDFDSRIYAFESDLPYSYSVPAFQGKGSRYYLMLKYKVNKKFQLWFRFAHSSYEGVQSTGSGYDKIDGHNVSDAKIELIWNY